MKGVYHYFDLAKAKSGSDYRTAKELGISANRISMARKGQGMNNAMARDLAEYIGVNPIEVIAAAEATKHPEQASKWAKYVASVCPAVSALFLINQSVMDELAHILYRLCKINNSGQRERLAL